MENETDRKGLYIIAAIIIVIIGICLSYVIKDKTNNKPNEDVKQQENTNNNNDNNNTTNINDSNLDNNTSTKDDNKSNVTNDNNTSIITDINSASSITSKVVGLNSRNDEVWYEAIHKGADFWVVNIYYQNNKIKEVTCNQTWGDVKRVYQIGDVILYSLVFKDNTASIYIIDKEGNTLKEIKEYDDDMLLIGSDENIIVSGDTITLKVRNNSYACVKDSTSDKLANATYTIKYLGNNKLSDLEIISKKTISEVCNK